ncbi:MAG: metallophosphatase family protein [Candidatus Gastranaerophilales bacterium]|nr:metallophosphatase family protein [Candidatus Gastranaerophilales bacterium]
MKIAVISDIHGNKPALDNVLSDINYIGADKIFVLGDLAMGGYDPNYTIEKIFSLENAEIIQGNTDKMIVNYPVPVSNPLMENALKKDVEEITDKNKNLLANLEENKIIQISGIKIQICHGSPRNQEENIFPDTPLETVEEIVSKTDAGIIFCGHTHIPCGFSLNSGKTLVNAGSIGRPMTEDRVPVYLLFQISSNGEFSFEYRKVKYDNKKVSEIMAKRLGEEFSRLYLRR